MRGSHAIVVWKPRTTEMLNMHRRFATLNPGQVTSKIWQFVKASEGGAPMECTSLVSARMSPVVHKRCPKNGFVKVV